MAIPKYKKDDTKVAEKIRPYSITAHSQKTLRNYNTNKSMSGYLPKTCSADPI